MEKSSRGYVRAEALGPKTVLLTVSGHWDVSSWKTAAADLERLIGGKTGVDLFIDAGSLTGYDSETRSLATQWVLDHRASLRSFHGMMGTSKIVAMGVAVANLALGGMLTAHSDRRSFERALEAVGAKLPPQARSGSR